MEGFDLRTVKDRRKQPTPAITRYTLWGRRKAFQRKEERERGGYVDRYHPKLLILLTLGIGLTVLDALFTMMILDDGGWEINPVVRSAIHVYGDRFWIWKFILVSIPLPLLCIHSKFRLVMPVLYGITSISALVILYQVYLYIF
ncbi:MAG: hypothetical protein FJ110_04235 [Deltaproteobacteria bacterium]|nr:hypothetical protein [Deltaproteobacteria bacterium]